MAEIKGYRPRIMDPILAERLKAIGGVMVEGARGSGKTQLATRQAGSVSRLDVDVQQRTLAELSPSTFLQGATPQLIDEWQLVPSLWDQVRREIDDRRLPGQFILTGSATPEENTRFHTGIGRLSRLQLRPMTLFETGASTGHVSLSQIFQNAAEPTLGSHNGLEFFAELIIRGGWPAMLDQSPVAAQQFSIDYVESLLQFDVPQISGGIRNSQGLKRLLTAYAQLSAHPVSKTKIIDRATHAEDDPKSADLARTTADSYLDAAQRLMILDDIDAWSPGLRSRIRLSSTPKRFLVDPSLAAALMRVDASGLINDLNTMGFLFEALVIRDLRVYAQPLEADVYHYREHATGLEVDAIIQGRDGRWIGCEVKMGVSQIDSAAESLLKVARKIASAPAALMVIVMSGPAYQRPDGVWVVPIDQLGP